MNARITAAEASYLLPAATAEQERAHALRLQAAEAHQAQLAQAGRLTLARLSDTLFGWARRARVRAELETMTDRELADIGLARGDVEYVVQGRRQAA